jgi:DNA-binding CsgD family transcriptional regulator
VTGTEAEAQCGRLLLLGAWAAADLVSAAGASRRLADRAAVRELEGELRALAAAAKTGPCGSQPRHFFAWNDAVRAQWSAELSRLVGADDPAIWVAAAEHWHRLRRPYFEGYCLMRAVALAVARRVPTATTKPWFDGALAIATRLRAAWLHEQLNALAAGLHVSLPTSPGRRRAGSNSDDLGLTEREREVLALLASGLTNAQLASRLFISTHTANVHVSRILTKLGVPNRTQAASVAWATGLAGQEDVAK